MRAMRAFDKQLQNIYASYATHIKMANQREHNIENASAFGIDRIQYEKMEDILSANPHCNMSVMDLIYLSHSGIKGSLAGEKLRQSIILPATKEKCMSQSFVPLSPLSHKEFLIAQALQSVLEFKQNTESEFKNDYQKCRRPNEGLRARLRGWIATAISPSYCTA